MSNGVQAKPAGVASPRLRRSCGLSFRWVLASHALAAGLACVSVTASGAADAPPPPAPVTVSTSVTGLFRFASDLERGGDVEASRVNFGLGVKRQFVPAFSATLSLGLDYQDWRFGSAPAFGGGAPWGKLEQQAVSLNLGLAVSRSALVALQPFVEWASEPDASRDDAMTYGALVSAVKVFSPALTLGGGARVTRQFYAVRTTPYVIVNWRINDRFRIANAFPAGPAGGGGIELRVKPAPTWEIAAGGVVRTDRFRLAAQGPYAGNVGEAGGIPLFLRLSRELASKLRVDLYGGAIANGKLEIKNGDGDEVASEACSTAPLVALTLSGRF